MHYQLQLEIDLPRQRVLEIFLDPKKLIKWQPGLIGFDQITEGDARSVGVKSKLTYKRAGRVEEIIETITEHNYPDKFCATYEAKGIWNLIENRFSEVNEDRTKWVLDSEFRCSSLPLKLLTTFLPGILKKETISFMMRFKEFAEKKTNDC